MLKLSSCFLFAFIFVSAFVFSVSAQVDSVVGQITSTGGGTGVFVRDISGDGRFVVFESNGDLATQGRTDTIGVNGQVVSTGRNNADGNIEIFLFDYAQRRIFQLTNTKAALTDLTLSGTLQSNIRVSVANTRPVISNDGRWIAFASNAVSTIAGNTNPGFFDGNLIQTVNNAATRTTALALEADGNFELWMYQIPIIAPVGDLSSGAEIPFTDLAGGAFLQATSTTADLPPLPGTAIQAPIIRDSNTSPSITDDGTSVAFVSDRDLIATNNTEKNREIYVFRRTSATAGTIAQVTKTAAGTIIDQIYNINPAIAGNGSRVTFSSTAENPVDGATGGSNADINLEIFYANLDANGAPTGTAAVRQKQLTVTTRTAPEQTVNLSPYGRRISRDGRFIAFESLSDNPGSGGTLQLGYALFVFDASPPVTTPATPNIRQFASQSFADAGAGGGDVRRYPTFTDYDANGTPQTLVFGTRFNYTTTGTIPGTAADGLNPSDLRPVQIYSTPLYTGTQTGQVTANLALVRLSQFDVVGFSDVQPFVSNSRRRISFTQIGELGGGNSPEFNNEAFYLISPLTILPVTEDRVSYFTGASARPVASPIPIPSPSASPSPSPSGSPVATPTPITPSGVPGLSPGMLATVRFRFGRPSVTAAVAPQGASTSRAFELPIELAGATLSIDAAAAGIYSIDRRNSQVTFVVPVGTFAGNQPFVFNDNGRVTRGTIDIVPAQPDIFNRSAFPSSGGRARIFNATNRVLQSEPFTVTTFRVRPAGRTATILRVFLTGVNARNITRTNIAVRIGSQTLTAAQILTGAVQTDTPGVYTIDFALPSALNNAGDVPIVITTNVGTITTQSRLDDTAPRLRIL